MSSVDISKHAPSAAHTAPKPAPKRVPPSAWQWLKNVLTLTSKEFQTLLSDPMVLAIIAFLFTVSIYTISTGITTEVNNATVAVVDHDRSPMSSYLVSTLQPPSFQPPIYVADSQTLSDGFDQGEYIFGLEFPEDFEKDARTGKHPSVQLSADATAVSQAGVGLVYIQEIFNQETYHYLKKDSPLERLPVKIQTSVWFNPNTMSHWFFAVTNIVGFVFLLAMMLVGAAIIREKERGTIEHLLVMPVTANQIALAKIISNGVVIAMAALLSLIFVVQGWLGVQINGSIALYMLGTLVFLFSASAMGIMFATLAPTLPQFGLLSLPVYVILRLISGGDAPFESMPVWVQSISQFSPVTQYALFSHAVLFRNADLQIVGHYLVEMTVAGLIFMFFALRRFRSMLDKQG